MKRAILVAVVCTALAGPALADLGSVWVKEVSMGPNLIMTINKAGAVSNGKSVYVGIQNLALQQYGTDPIPDIIGYDPTNGTYSTFCIDIYDWSSGSPHVYDFVDLDEAPDNDPVAAGPMTAARAARLAELLNAHWSLAGTLTPIQSAALQAAIWEIVNEPIMAPSSYDVNAGATQGAFYLTGVDADGYKQDARDLANGWLRALSVGGVDFSNYLGLSNEGVQDYVVRVPVPAAFVLGLLGMGAAGLKLRKRA